MLLTYRDLLKDIFICIAFHWTSRRLPVLELVSIAACELCYHSRKVLGLLISITKKMMIAGAAYYQ